MRKILQSRADSPSFNPCSVGQLIQSRIHNEGGTIVPKFQSLFCWTINSKIISPKNTGSMTRGFNPCSVGQLIQSFYKKGVPMLNAIVSILVLLDN